MKKVELTGIRLGEDIDQLEEAAMKRLKEDPEVYKVIHDDLELSKGEVLLNLGTLIDLQEDMEICRSCPGVEQCPKAHPCYCMKLSYLAGQIQRSFEPCEKKKSRDQLHALFFIRDFPLEWLDYNLKNIDITASRRGLSIAFGKVMKGTDDRWLYVTGGHRQGKSFMLNILAKEYALKHRPAGFANTATLIEGLKQKVIKEKEKFERNMGLLQSCPLLVLDEFGNEFKSEFVFSTILYPLISGRAKAKMPTWFTSDFTIQEIVDMYRSKIGDARAKQFQRLLEESTRGEITIEGVNVY